MKITIGPIYSQVTGPKCALLPLYDHFMVPNPDLGPAGKSPAVSYEGRFLTGILPIISQYCLAKGLKVEVEGGNFWSPGKKVPSIPEDLVPGIVLRDYQIDAVRKLLLLSRGIVSVVGGGGKTVIAMASHLMLQRETPDCRTLVLVNREKLGVQTVKRFASAGITAGLVGGNYEEYDQEVTIGLVQSLYSGLRKKDPRVAKLLEETSLLVVDEAHHLPALTWGCVAAQCQAPYRLALTATPFEHSMDPKTYRDYALMGITGPVLLYMDSQSLVRRGVLARPIVCMLNSGAAKVRGSWEWHEAYAGGIVDCEARNEAALHLAYGLYRRGYKVLILVQQIRHGKDLIGKLHAMGYSRPYFSCGANSLYSWRQGKDRKESMSSEELLTYLDEESSYVFVGSSVYDQGIDVPSLNALIVLSGGKRLRTTLQRAYRALRAKDGPMGNAALIVDFMDYQHPYLLNHSKQREKLYQDMGFEVYHGHREVARIISETEDAQHERQAGVA